MTRTTQRIAALTFVTALAGGAALLPAPAHAQSGRTDYDTPSYADTSDQGYQNRTPMGGDRYGAGQNSYGNDRYAQGQFERGYRTGRDDERRMNGRSDIQSSAAMEFLDHARQQIDQGNLRAAWISLGRAETRLVTRSVPAGSGEEAATGGAVGAIRAARQALKDRDADLAQDRTERAIDLTQRNDMVGRNVSGASLRGAGMAGPGQPLTGYNRFSSARNNGYDNWND